MVKQVMRRLAWDLDPAVELTRLDQLSANRECNRHWRSGQVIPGLLSGQECSQAGWDDQHDQTRSTPAANVQKNYSVIAEISVRDLILYIPYVRLSIRHLAAFKLCTYKCMQHYPRRKKNV